MIASLYICFDVEIEGAVHFGNDLLRILNNGLKPGQLFNSNKGSSNSIVKLKSPEHQNIIVRHAYKQHSNEEVYKKHDKLATDVSTDILDKKHDDNKFNSNLKRQLSKAGSRKLEYLGHFITKKLKLHTNIDTILDSCIYDYKLEVKQYIDKISQKVVSNDIEKELFTLDIVESTNMILLTQAKQLLNELIIEANTHETITHTNLPLLLKYIHETVVQEKKEELAYICKMFNVCRIYPGYSDHIAKLISELLQMDDEKLDTISTSFKDAVFQKQDFFEKVIDKPVINAVSSKLSTSQKSPQVIKEILSVIRSVITQRYKIVNSEYTDITKRTIAVRILLDIIDKAFGLNGDEINTMDINITISQYKQWASGSRNDVDLITSKCISNALHILDYYWSAETKQEVKVLTDVIFTGKTKHEELYKYLFEMGSRFVSGVYQSHSDVE